MTPLRLLLLVVFLLWLAGFVGGYVFGGFLHLLLVVVIIVLVVDLINSRDTRI